jgi:hypothetical protein
MSPNNWPLKTWTQFLYAMWHQIIGFKNGHINMS